jgi:soluble lytic murein transglycosylase-like protein
MLAFAMLSGCMATDPSLAPTASFSTDMSSSTELGMVLPDTVDVLPQPSGRVETDVAYAMPQDLSAASFAGTQPSAGAPVETAAAASFAGAQPSAGVPAPTAAAATEHVFLEPEPVALKPPTRPFQLPPVAGGTDEVNLLIVKYAELYDVPVELVRRVAKRESNFRPTAYNRGHWGIMQIKHATARGMGYDGPPKGLLDAETNLKYAVKYLAGAWLVADRNPDLADRLYQSGYYYHAKRKGLLDETGLGRDRVRRRAPTI